jgi:hypothetical protein
VRRRLAARLLNFLNRLVRLFRADIKDIHARATRRKTMRDRAADAARSSGDDGRAAIEPESIGILGRVFQRETPRFQGMKSF